MSVNEHDAGVAEGRSPSFDAPDWWIYRGTGRAIHDIDLTEMLPAPPPWRDFQGELPAEPDLPPEDDGEADRRLGSEVHLDPRFTDPAHVDR